jgi:hypothetical protein
MATESPKPSKATLSVIAIKPKEKKETASPTRDQLAAASEEIPQDIQNTLKDRMQEKEFSAGEAERKASMGSAFKKGGPVKSSSASKRADGIAQRGKTRGKMV